MVDDDQGGPAQAGSEKNRTEEEAGQAGGRAEGEEQRARGVQVSGWRGEGQRQGGPGTHPRGRGCLSVGIAGIVCRTGASSTVGTGSEASAPL